MSTGPRSTCRLTPRPAELQVRLRIYARTPAATMAAIASERRRHTVWDTVRRPSPPRLESRMHRFVRPLLLAVALAAISCPVTADTPADTPAAAPAPKSAAPSRVPTTEEQKTLYTLGLLLSGTVQSFQLSAQELSWVTAGLTDATLNRPALTSIETYGPKVEELQASRMAVVAAREKQNGKAFLDKAASAPGAQRTASGLVITPIVAGTGASPQASDQVKVHYEGRLTDGTVFDSSRQRGEPATFPLAGVIRCWTEAVPRMKVGGRSRIVCPSELAYGDGGSPPRIPGGATLVFDVELLDIVK